MIFTPHLILNKKETKNQETNNRHRWKREAKSKELEIIFYGRIFEGGFLNI